MNKIYIAKEYVARIINNDFSGATDEEEALINAFCKEHKVFSLAVLNDEHDNFHKCAITGLESDCYEVEILH
jgi:hypothetical protein